MTPCSPEQFSAHFSALETAIGQVIVGQQDVVRASLAGLLADGNILLEGVPGLGKTALVASMGQALDLSFGRIQFTPDLMPADITGTRIILDDEQGNRSFHLQKGPVFRHIVLADEINRATPKTQSALLEAMQERQVTILGETLDLPEPFFVVATQNPLEMEGTYPLPEAQMDRFLMKVQVNFPSASELGQILERTTSTEHPRVTAVCGAQDVLAMRALVRSVPVAPELRDLAIGLVLATHPELPEGIDTVKRYVRFGASPRGAQSLLLAAKARTLMDARTHTTVDDLAVVARPCLRHRLVRNFEGEADDVSVDSLVDAVVGAVLP